MCTLKCINITLVLFFMLTETSGNVIKYLDSPGTELGYDFPENQKTNQCLVDFFQLISGEDRQCSRICLISPLSGVSQQLVSTTTKIIIWYFDALKNLLLHFKIKSMPNSYVQYVTQKISLNTKDAVF